MGLMQSLLRVVYPPHCLLCSDVVEDENGLCPSCWRDTPFIRGLVCDLCGVPLPGEDPGTPVHCDDCRARTYPWRQGRAALVYRDAGRRMALSFKHGDRTDLAQPAARWMLRAAEPLLRPGLMVVPVPLNRWRLLKRRYNQAALLSQEVARLAGLDHCPDLLLRPRPTPTQKARDREARFANLADALVVNPRRHALLQDRQVLLVDDVMTTGATLTAATQACLSAGAQELRILTLARAARDD